MGIVSQLQKVSAVIAHDGTVSAAVCLEGGWLISLEVPDIVSTALSFQTSHDGVTYQALHDSSGADLSITVADNGNYNIADKQIFANFIKVVSGSAESGAAGATIGLVYMQIK